MARNKIINDIRKYLVNEGIYTEKDEITLILLENTYNQYLQASKEVKESGQTLSTIDYNKNMKVVINPSFRNQLELQKELFKLIESLYLTPKSRKSKKEIVAVNEENPFIELMKEVNKT
ncbi:P27 family phage terminase small subunit [Candidatus Nomurabacteria bacterium]|nr:P27 family phage terminase small subunit [Candidatus Nomurabacteria bacterium]